MTPRRPTTYWVILAGVALFAAAAARVGLGLLREVEQAPHRVEWALQARIGAGEVLEAVMSLEAARRGYRLRPSAPQLEELQREHERVHAAFGQLRLNVGDDPAMRASLDDAERVVGVWAAERVPSAVAAGARAAAARETPGLARVRDRLAAVIAAGDRAHEQAQRDVGIRHRRVELVWLAGTALLVLLFAIYHDLAHRRQQRVMAATSQMDLLLGALPFALLGLDRNLRIRQATGFIHRVLGATTRDVRGLVVTDLVAPADRATLAAAMQTALGGAARECVVVTPAAGHAARALSVMCSPIREDAAIVGVSAVVHDVTTEHTLRTQVLQSDRLATIGALVAGVVHEVNNPLTAIVAYAGLVDREPLTVEDRAAIECIDAEARRAAQITRNLLDFSRQRIRAHESTDLAAVVERAIALRRYELTSRRVELTVELAAGLPTVEGDAQQLQQVVLNLLINAEHAVGDRAERRVLVRLARVTQMVRLSVEDNGPGVPEDQRSAVFEPFFTTKAEGQGTGLGLSVSRGIVDAHLGRMWVDSGALGGARFVVELPCTAAPPEARTEPSLAAGAPPAGAAVLIVDDEPVFRDSLGRLLEHLGFRVTLAADGGEALATLARATPDAILCDIHMPGLNGAGFYRALAARSPALAKRIAFMTGGGSTPESAFVAAQGCVVLRKPFEAFEVRCVLEALSRGSKPVAWGSH